MDAASATVSRETPPSTMIGSAGAASRSARIVGSGSRMKRCPPKPGKTVITRISSTSGRCRSAAAAGESGLRTSPARHPSSRTRRSAAATSHDDSAWTWIVVAPAFA